MENSYPITDFQKCMILRTHGSNDKILGLTQESISPVTNDNFYKCLWLNITKQTIYSNFELMKYF